MGRPPKYHFNETKILTAIWTGTHGRRAALTAERDSLPKDPAGWSDYQWLSREIAQCDWGRSEKRKRLVLRDV